MNKFKKVAIAAAATVALLSNSTTVANAHGVGHITCATEDSCEITYAPNEGAGYWMANIIGSSTLVRLTLVPGWNNTHVAPITCKWYSSCVIAYYNGYWMARQASGTTWVRLTLVNGS